MGLICIHIYIMVHHHMRTLPFLYTTNLYFLKECSGRLVTLLQAFDQPGSMSLAVKYFWKTPAVHSCQQSILDHVATRFLMNAHSCPTHFCEILAYPSSIILIAQSLKMCTYYSASIIGTSLPPSLACLCTHTLSYKSGIHVTPLLKVA